MHFGKHYAHINNYKAVYNMRFRCVLPIVFFLNCFISAASFAVEEASDQPATLIEPTVGSWTFSGVVSNESGDRYGYFFQILRQGDDFHAKTALIDGQTNQLILFYENDAKIVGTTSLDWHVGRSFIRYNPINESWIFGIKEVDKKGFNFKVDMLKQENNDDEVVELRPGLHWLALQTSSLNGHIETGEESKEAFVIGSTAWFGKLWVSIDQQATHAISTTYCRLSDENGFYSANLKETDATQAAVTGWRDATGNKVKMSQFISIATLADNQSLLSVGVPKLNLKLTNALSNIPVDPASGNQPDLTLAGFSQESKGFCFVTEQVFLKANPVS